MLWGCGFFFGKIALREMNVGAMVFYRFVFATLGLLPLMLTHKPRLSAKEWRLLLIGSFFGIPLQFLIQFYGLSLTTVSHASLMVGTMPVILAVGATIFARERLPLLGWIAIAASTCGAALIVFGKSVAAAAAHPSLRGDLMVVASMLIALVWILSNKKLMESHSSIVITSYGVLSGMLMLVLMVPMLYGVPPVHLSAKAWAASAAAGFLCTAATTLLWNWGLTQVPASQAGVLLNMEPLIGSLLGVFLLGERLGTAAYVGGGMIVVAAVTLTFSSSRAAKEAIAAELS